MNAPALAPHGERPRQRHLLPPDVGRMLAGRRWELHLSVRQMARRAGCAHGFISMLEHGQRAPSVSMATGLATAYELGPADRRALLAAAVPGAGRDWRYRHD